MEAHNLSSASSGVVTSGSAEFVGPVAEVGTRLIAWFWPDVLMVLVFCVVGGYGSYQLSARIDPVIFDYSTLNTWFDADIPRNFVDMNYQTSEFYTTHRHPLLPLMEFAPVYFLKHVFHLDPITSVRITLAGVASLWLGVFCIALRLMGCRRFDAALFSMLAASSAASMFWLVVAETTGFSALTIAPALALVALSEHRALSPIWYVAASAATLSVTVTNWMIGIFVTVVNHHWKRCLQTTLIAFSVVALLWAVQKFLFPGTLFFFGDSDVALPEAEAGGLLYVLNSFFFHGVVMPAIKVTYWFYHPNLPVMTVQPSLPGSAGMMGAIAALAWIGLLGLGIWGLLTMKYAGKLRAFLALAISGQLALHLLFGREIFLYSLHFTPLLILLAAFSIFTPARFLGLFFAGIVTVFGGINNAMQFAEATDFVHRKATESHLVRAAMRERPLDHWPRGNQHVLLSRPGIARKYQLADSWPRGTGHVVLGRPGSVEIEKAYHEPGGSFSPAVGSFGISIWIRDSSGELQASSDTLPLSTFYERFVWREPKEIPGIVTDSTYYRALWSANELGEWQLSLGTPKSDITPAVVVRSVGPAGGPIRSLVWDNQQLLVNNRWKMIVQPQPKGIYLGEEGARGWMKAESKLTEWQGDSGWGYARFDLTAGNEYRITLIDTNRARTSNAVPNSASPNHPSIQLPDERFAASLRAQVAHLLMGLVNNESRPGDPMSYPFPWLRDEAYTTVALARAGQLTIAKELARHLAQEDFFGGFGAEADAPGLALWATVEVATQLKDPQYERWIWPHVRRKAEIILGMVSATRAIHIPLRSPVIPLYTKPLKSTDPDPTLLADASGDSLIRGRVDNSRPVLYVNAVSYQGLVKAAMLANRLGEFDLARNWRTGAARLQQAWTTMLGRIPYLDQLSYSSALWPTWAAERGSKVFRSAMETRWNNDLHGDLLPSQRKTFFQAAEAHQWLLFGREDRAWNILLAFWQHQSAPGMYTWGVDSGKDNTFAQWEKIRGWLNGEEDVGQEDVTPYYRTSAEILLLQLNMLAYSDETTSEPTLVIGAGVQPSWLDQPMAVQGLFTPLGQVDWTWNGREMNVKVRGGAHPRVKLGAAFRRATPLHVEYVI